MSPPPAQRELKNTRKWRYVVYVCACLSCLCAGAYISWEYIPRTDEFKAKYEQMERERNSLITQLNHVQAATTETIERFRADSLRNSDRLAAYQSELLAWDRYTDSISKRDDQTPVDHLYIEYRDSLRAYRLRPKFDYSIFFK